MSLQLRCVERILSNRTNANILVRDENAIHVRTLLTSFVDNDIIDVNTGINNQYIDYCAKCELHFYNDGDEQYCGICYNSYCKDCNVIKMITLLCECAHQYDIPICKMCQHHENNMTIACRPSCENKRYHHISLK